MVVAQRLVRRLCPHCQKRLPDAQPLPLSLWPRPLPHWTAPGCEHCYHGYQGRLALFELLPLTPTLRQYIASGLSPAELQVHARESGMTTLFENGCRAVEQGLTTQEELLRVLGLPQDA